METLIGTLHPLPPYDFALTVSLSRYYTVLGTFDGESYLRAVRLRSGLALVRVVNRGSINLPALDVYLVTTQGLIDLDELMRRVAGVLHIHDNLQLFYLFARADPILWMLIEPLYGLHILQTETLFEALAVTVIEQQIALTAAQRGERWLVEWAGEAVLHAGEPHYVFPTAERIAEATVDALTPLKITFKRMSVLIDIAQQFNTAQHLQHLPLQRCYEALMAIRGVGHWTAAWALTRGMGHYIYVGSADVALRAAVNHYFFGQKGRCSHEETDAIFGRYGEHAGAASFYTLMRWALEKY